jgi:quinol monooxygenase YgiN
VVCIKAKPEKESRVKQELIKILAPTRAEPGYINFDLHQSTDNPSLFRFYENWVSEVDQMPYLRAWLEQADSLLDAPMELTRWQKVS